MTDNEDTPTTTSSYSHETATNTATPKFAFIKKTAMQRMKQKPLTPSWVWYYFKESIQTAAGKTLNGRKYVSGLRHHCTFRWNEADNGKYFSQHPATSTLTSYPFN